MLKIREKFLSWLIDMATNHRRIVYLSTLIITLILGGAAGTLKMDMRCLLNNLDDKKQRVVQYCFDY